MYKIDVNKVLETFTGQPIKDPVGKDLTVKSVLVSHMGAYGANPQPAGRGQAPAPIPGEQLIRAYTLGQKIFECEGELELDADQCKFIKQVVLAKPLFTSLVTGQLLSILEGSKVEKDVKDSKK